MGSPKTALDLDAQKVHEIFSMWDKYVPTVEELREWFTDDLVFEDPLQRTEGIVEYREMNERLLKKNHDLKIQMEAAAQTGLHIMFTFSLSMAPSPKRPQTRIYNTGMTYVRLNDEGKIEYHRDFWDFNTMFLSAFPKGAQEFYKKMVKKLG
ncbi:MAG: nuclear transport factor 2 family protein [Candidatus Binatia bacterium]|nr:nuclear transport factor 2 family protein [Candidatus Binatia bacterium]